MKLWIIGAKDSFTSCFLRQLSAARPIDEHETTPRPSCFGDAILDE
jgi:hypothetical protein